MILINFCFVSKSLSDNVHFHTQKEIQGGMKLKTRIKFNHNIHEIFLTQMIHAKLSKTRKQLKGRQCNVHVRFPSAASDHNKFITKEMCQLHKETLYCAQVS